VKIDRLPRKLFKAPCFEIDKRPNFLPNVVPASSFRSGNEQFMIFCFQLSSWSTVQFSSQFHNQGVMPQASGWTIEFSIVRPAELIAGRNP